MFPLSLSSSTPPFHTYNISSFSLFSPHMLSSPLCPSYFFHLCSFPFLSFSLFACIPSPYSLQMINNLSLFFVPSQQVSLTISWLSWRQPKVTSCPMFSSICAASPSSIPSQWQPPTWRNSTPKSAKIGVLKRYEVICESVCAFVLFPIPPFHTHAQAHKHTQKRERKLLS